LTPEDEKRIKEALPSYMYDHNKKTGTVPISLETVEKGTNLFEIEKIKLELEDLKAELKKKKKGAKKKKK